MYQVPAVVLPTKTFGEAQLTILLVVAVKLPEVVVTVILT